MILNFKEQFPWTPVRPTHFKDSILASLYQHHPDWISDEYRSDYARMQSVGARKLQKVHDIRPGDRWAIGDTIHFATGARTSHYDCFAVGEVTGVQSIWIESVSPKEATVSIDYQMVHHEKLAMIAFHDGLSAQDFYRWFWHHYGRRDQSFRGQLIHWTDLRYDERISEPPKVLPDLRGQTSLFPNAGGR